MAHSSHIPSLRSPLSLKDKQSLLKRRGAIVDAIRAAFRGMGFMEVETPLRIPAPAPELYIDAEPSGSRFLITSPELQMKRLLAAGYEKVFQLCRCFRQGERGRHHLPEFTMLEWYRLGGTVADLMRDTEQLIAAAARAVDGYPTVKGVGAPIDLTPPYPSLEVADAFERYAGWRPSGHPDPDRFDRDLVDKVEPSLPRETPIFLTGYPASLASLARIDPKKPERSERFELYAGGLELANGFGELTCPVEQRHRFVKEREARKKAGKSVYPLDEHFLSALDRGLAPSAGIALGIDRLVMVLLGCDLIDDVVAFPEGSF